MLRHMLNEGPHFTTSQRIFHIIPPLTFCSVFPESREVGFRFPRGPWHWPKHLSTVHGDLFLSGASGLFLPQPPSCLFLHSFILLPVLLLWLELTHFPQALPSEPLETVLEIKNKYPKLTSPQGYVLASG